MSRRTRSLLGPKGMDMVEESIALLRQTPASAWLCYLIGSIPFWLALLYFLADMSRSAYATERLAGSSLGMALLFLWMKCWHGVFAERLMAIRTLKDAGSWTPGRALRLISTQVTVQPWGLLLRPLALLITLPFVWVSSFFHAATVLGADESAVGKSFWQKAWDQTFLWPGQAHVAVSAFGIFSFFVWLNLYSAMLAIPMLLKMFFDVETMVSRSISAMTNTTTLSASFALTVLLVDPLWKALYVLRCFYGDAIRSGMDLRVQLKTLQKTAVMILIAGACLLGAPQAGAQPAPSQAAQVSTAPVNPADLNRSIDDVLQRREYAWRMPRQENGSEDAPGWWKSVRQWFKDQQKQIERWAMTFRDWLKNRFKKDEDKQSASSSLAELPVQEILFVLLGVTAVTLVITIYRMVRAPRLGVLEAQTVEVLPDLQSEDVVADQLPEDGWLKMMREMIEGGQLRLALRAAYLASLAHLGSRELLTIARYKSNREYDRELRRRARDRQDLLLAFGENLLAFERVWYGRYEATRETLEHFARNLETIRSC